MKYQPAAMREADRRVSAELGLPGAVLMENGGCVTEAVAAINTQRQKVVIVAGPEIMAVTVVAARLLSQAGFTVFPWSTSRPGQTREMPIIILNFK